MPVRKTAEERNMRRLAILKDIEMLGVQNVNISSLARAHDVTRVQIYKDIDFLMAQVPKPKIKTLFGSIHLLYNKALAQASRILVDPDSTKDEKLKAARTVGYLEERFTRMLEAYGIKDRVAEKVDSEIRVRYVSAGWSSFSKGEVVDGELVPVKKEKEKVDEIGGGENSE